MLRRLFPRLHSPIAPSRVQKGNILKHEGHYVQVTSTKTNHSGVVLEYLPLSNDNGKAKLIRLKDYETVEMIDTEFIVEVEKIDLLNGMLVTTNALYEQTEVPVSLLNDSELKQLKPGSKLGILMDGDVFVKLVVKGNIPSWMKV